MKVPVGVIGLAVVGLVVAVVPVAGQELGGPEGAVTQPANPYTPPPCVAGVPFADVTCNTPFDVWIEQFYRDEITAGCGGGNYCPDDSVTRAQMAVFIEKAMRGTDYWSPGDVGSGNTAAGQAALPSNSPYAQYNTAVGFEALYSQSYANGNVNYDAGNTAIGTYALWSNQPDGGNNGANGTENTAVGMHSLEYSTHGYGNAGVGVYSLYSNTVGAFNTAIGEYALYSNTMGGFNTAIGEDALLNNTTGNFNTAIGPGADVASGNLSNATAVGYLAIADASDEVRIGNDTVTQIGGAVGWSGLSDVRAKKDIADLDLGLDFVMSLRPVSFQLIKGNGRTDMGFIAQDIEGLLGDGYNVLGIGGDKDRTLSLRYTDFIAPVVNAIQEQQAEIVARDARIESLEARLAKVESQLEALATHGGAATSAK